VHCCLLDLTSHGNHRAQAMGYANGARPAFVKFRAEGVERLLDNWICRRIVAVSNPDKADAPEHRERLVAAARRLTLAKGVNVGIDAILDEAGVDRGSRQAQGAPHVTATSWASMVRRPTCTNS
jgi:hypothetical protein